MVTLKLKPPEGFLAEEVRDGWTISRKMKEVWAVCLDLLMEFSRVCGEHGIEFFAFHGTLLGAARHRGFIPWDDDVDLAMTRENFNRLCEIAPDAFRAPYFFQTEFTDIGMARVFARLRNSDTTAIQRWDNHRGYPHYNQGIFIDIFPIDNLPDDPAECTRWTEELQRLSTNAFKFSEWSTRYCPETIECGNRVVRKCLRLARGAVCRVCRLAVEGFHIYNPYVKRYLALAQKYNDRMTRNIGDVHEFPTSGKCVYPRELFSELTMLPFEWLEIPAPAQYERILDIRYENWRTPNMTGTHHGDILFDTDAPYVEVNRRRKKRRKTGRQK